MSRTRRCPKHPTGCPKHPNPNPARGTLPMKERVQRGRSQRRGSIERYIAIQHTHGSGNPARRRWLVRRGPWEAGRG